MSEWGPVRLGDSATTYAGGTPDRTKPEYFGGPIPWVKSTEVNLGQIRHTEETLSALGLASSAAKWIPANTVVVALYGATAAQVGFLTFKATANQAVLAIIPNDQLDSTFLFYSLTSAKERLLFQAQGSGQPNLNKQIVDNLRLDVPKLPEQRKIALILTTLDKLIEKTESLIAKYQAIKQGMMHDLFTRGVDAHGHLRPTQAEAPDLYKQSELGWIPKEWEVGRLVNRITFPQGQVDPRRLPYRDWILVAPDHIEQRTGRLLGRQTAADQGAISGKYEFLAGDVVYSKIRPYLRKAILASEHGICSADMYPLRPLPALRSQCLLGIVLGEHFSRFAESVSARSGFPKINRSELAEYHASFPELNEQDRICRIIESHERQAEREQALLAKYKQQKTGLMQDLLTGKVRVKVDEAEEVAP